MAKQIIEAKENKMRFCFDVGQQVIALPKAVLHQGVKAAELVILNDYELGILAKASKQSEEKVLSEIKTCVFTLGEKGSKIYTREAKTEVNSVFVAKPVDPTGAGDAFRAGFLYGYVRSWPLINCARLGSTVASFAIEKIGAQEHCFSKKTLAKRYAKTYQEKLSI